MWLVRLISRRVSDRSIGNALLGTPDKSPNPFRRKSVDRQLTSASWPTSEQDDRQLTAKALDSGGQRWR